MPCRSQMFTHKSKKTHALTLIAKTPPAEQSDAHAERIKERAGPARQKRERKARSGCSAQAYGQPRDGVTDEAREAAARPRSAQARPTARARGVSHLSALSQRMRSHSGRSRGAWGVVPWVPIPYTYPADAALDDDADARRRGSRRTARRPSSLPSEKRPVGAIAPTGVPSAPEQTTNHDS